MGILKGEKVIKSGFISFEEAQEWIDAQPCLGGGRARPYSRWNPRAKMYEYTVLTRTKVKPEKPLKMHPEVF